MARFFIAYIFLALLSYAFAAPLPSPKKAPVVKQPKGGISIGKLSTPSQGETFSSFIALDGASSATKPPASNSVHENISTLPKRGGFLPFFGGGGGGHQQQQQNGNIHNGFNPQGCGGDCFVEDPQKQAQKQKQGAPQFQPPNPNAFHPGAKPKRR
ncbi:hypothetical protein M422DRAFT_50992 [Sphaerobolus stellatus SS14]|uniref:Uncharacterized protein n=1 Tax=Sphaerobolus stellatus (strain SS14) TaxID=990650 RepID=A0A0C9V433_SPHS4|nr:hypothetical protein M422DRAFT_50992 [Sphaerobolus stellatus SS14]